MNIELRLIDFIIIIFSLIVVASIPYIFLGRKKNKEEYLMAGRNVHWLTLSIASVAAGFSGISFLGAPGYVMAHNMTYLPSLFVGIVSIFFVYYFVLPFLYKLSLVSVYEYLEQRFSRSLRFFASFMFMLTKLAYLSIVIYVPSMALSAATGIDVRLLIIITGAVTISYTFFGGLDSVIWTGFVQYIIIVVGLLAIVCFFAYSESSMGLSAYWNIAAQAGKTRTFDFSLNFSSTTVWVLMISSTLMGTAGMCSDQSSIQQYLAAKNVAHACKGYFVGTFFGVPIVLVLYFIGIWTYGFFQQNGHILPPAIASQPDRIFPYFVAKYLPPGVSGIVFASVLAASMGASSAVMHSLTSLTMVDYYERFAKNKEKGKHYVNVSRCFSVIWGTLGILIAFYIMKLGTTIIEVTIIAGSLFAAPLGGIYFLGIFTKRANNTGAIVGGILGVAVTVIAYTINKLGIRAIDFNWFGVFGILTTFIMGYVVSLMFPELKKIPQSVAEQHPIKQKTTQVS